MATIKEIFASDALLWLEFGGQYTDSSGKRVIDNLAQRGDAPKTVQCGNGVTSTTFPTQLAGKRGVSFDGGDWIDCGLIDRFERTDAFTLFIVTTMNTAATGYHAFFESMDQAQSYRGINFGQFPSSDFTFNIISTYPTNVISGSVSAATLGASARTTSSKALVCTGNSLVSGCTMYQDAKAFAPAVGSNTLSSTIKNGKPILIGGRHNGAVIITNMLFGTVHFAAIFPLAATALQIQNLHKRVMRRINLP